MAVRERESRRGFNQIKPVHDSDQLDGQLNLTASTFNQMGQYTSSPGRRGNCYAELAIFFPNVDCNHRVPTHRGMARLSWPGWLVT